MSGSLLVAGSIVAAILLVALAVAIAATRQAQTGKRLLSRELADAQNRERRSAAYLDAALAWHGYIQTLRPLAFPEEGVTANRQRDLAAVLRSRAQLELFGSPVVQRLHEESLEQAVTLIDLLRSMPRTLTGEPDIAAGRYVLRFVLGEVAKKADALERQMNRELHAPVSTGEDLVEVTGRRLTRSGSPRNGRAPAELVADSRVHPR